MKHERDERKFDFQPIGHAIKKARAQMENHIRGSCIMCAVAKTGEMQRIDFPGEVCYPYKGYLCAFRRTYGAFSEVYGIIRTPDPENAGQE